MRLADLEIFQLILNRRVAPSQSYPFFYGDPVIAETISLFYPDVMPVSSNFFEADGSLRLPVFDDVLSRVDKSKCPGAPLVYVCSTNEYLDVIKDQVYTLLNVRISALRKLGRFLTEALKVKDKQVLRRLYGYDAKSALLSEVTSDLAVALVELGCCDVILQRVKSETRRLGKTPRLVGMVSVIDTLIDRLLCTDFIFNERAMNSPTATQLDLNTRSKCQELYEEFKRNAPLTADDVRAWDYSTHPYHINADVIRKGYAMGLCSVRGVVVPGREEHFQLLLARSFCLTHRVLATEEGVLFCSHPGFTTSGALDTFSKNSFSRVLLSCQVQQQESRKIVKSYCKSAGDDFQSRIAGRVETYKKFGFTLTDREVQTDEFHFCSTTFKDGASYQDNIEKFVTGLLFDPNDWDLKLAALQQFVSHPRYDEMNALLSAEYELLLASNALTTSDQ